MSLNALYSNNINANKTCSAASFQSPALTDKFEALCEELSTPSSDLESIGDVSAHQQQQQQQQQHEMCHQAAAEEFVDENNISEDRYHSETSVSVDLPFDSLEENSYDYNEVKHDDSDDDDVILGTAADISSLSPSSRRSPSPVAKAKASVIDVDGPPPPASNEEEMAERAARRAAWPFTGISEPGINDCLFGRGGGTNHHPGNKRYRKIVEDRKEKYLTSKRLDKPLVAMDIINEWRALDPPGRFLKQNEVTKLWDDVGDKKAREKTSQALREKTPVKQREGEQDSRGGHDTQDGARSARFQPGTTSPVNRHVKRSSLARDHSLGGVEMVENEISLEGFSWDERDEPVVPVGDVGLCHSYPTHQYPSGGHYGQYPPPPPPPGGEYYRPAYETQHSLGNNSLPDATVLQPAPPVYADIYYGHHYPHPPQGQGYPPPPSGQGYGAPPPPPPSHKASYPPPPNHNSPPSHQYHYSQQAMPPPPQQQLRSPADRSYLPPAYDDGSGGLPPPPPPQGYYGGYSPQHGWPTPPGPTNSYHPRDNAPSAFRRYDSIDWNDSSRSLGSSVGGGGYYESQYGGVPPMRGPPVLTNSAARRPGSGKSVLREDPASAGTPQDYSKLANLIRDSSDNSSIDRTTSLVGTGDSRSSIEKDIRRTMSMPQEGSGRSLAGVQLLEEANAAAENNNVKKKSSLMHKLSGRGMAARNNNVVAPPSIDGILRNSNADGVHRPDMVKRDTSNVPVERSMKRVVLSRDQSEVARRLKEEHVGSEKNVAVGVSSKLTKAELLDRKMSVEMNMLGLDDKVLGRVTTEGYLKSFMDSGDSSTSSLILEASSRKERVTTIDEIALDIANGKPPEEWDDTLDLVGLTESEIAEKWLKGDT